MSLAFWAAGQSGLRSRPVTPFFCVSRVAGPEYYHEAHRQFHPTYRAILYERNYYDIFIFDLQGSRLFGDRKRVRRQSDLFGVQGRVTRAWKR